MTLFRAIAKIQARNSCSSPTKRYSARVTCSHTSAVMSSASRGAWACGISQQRRLKIAVDPCESALVAGASPDQRLSEPCVQHDRSKAHPHDHWPVPQLSTIAALRPLHVANAHTAARET